MKTKLKGLMAIGAIALGQADLARAADANPPERMTYQGYLVDGNGDPLGSVADPSDSTRRVSAPANYDIIFRIYDVKQGGVALWAEQQTVTVDKGYFSVLLGEGSDFGNENRNKLSSVFSGNGISDRFIGITVDTGSGNIEIAPRLRLVASPYSFTATQARRLSDASGNSNFFKDGTELKLGAGSTPTLTLPDAGGATLVGKLTTDLAGWGLGLQIDNGDYTTTLGAGDVNSFNLSTSLGRFSFNKPLETSTIYLSNDAGLTATSGDYGTVMTTGSGKNGNDGYSIGGRYNFMANGDQYVGTFNDLDNKWLWLYDRNLDRHIWHSDGGNGRLTLSPTGLNVTENLNVGGSATVSGNVGIGTWTPYANLHVYEPANAGNGYEADVRVETTTQRLTLKSHHHPGVIQYSSIQSIANSGLAWALALNPDGGNVGIGTTSPSQALDVNGNIKLRGGAIVGSGSNYLVIEDYGSNNGCTIRPHANNFGSIGTANLRWDDGYITELWASLQGSDRRIKRDINPVGKNEMLEMIDDMSFYQYRLRFPNAEKMKRQGRDANGVFYGIMAQELREIYPNVVKSNGEAALLDENETDEDEILKNRWYVEKARLAELALGGIKDLYSISKEKDSEIESLKSKVENLESEMAVLKARLANSTTQEDRIAKLEELVSKIRQGQ